MAGSVLLHHDAEEVMSGFIIPQTSAFDRERIDLWTEMLRSFRQLLVTLDNLEVTESSLEDVKLWAARAITVCVMLALLGGTRAVRPTLLTYIGYEFFMMKFVRRGMTIREGGMAWLEDRHKLAFLGFKPTALGSLETTDGLERRRKALESQVKRMWFRSSIQGEKLHPCLARFLQAHGD